MSWFVLEVETEVFGRRVCLDGGSLSSKGDRNFPWIGYSPDVSSKLRRVVEENGDVGEG